MRLSLKEPLSWSHLFGLLFLDPMLGEVFVGGSFGYPLWPMGFFRETASSCRLRKPNPRRMQRTARRKCSACSHVQTRNARGDGLEHERPGDVPEVLRARRGKAKPPVGLQIVAVMVANVAKGRQPQP